MTATRSRGTPPTKTLNWPPAASLLTPDKEEQATMASNSNLSSPAKSEPPSSTTGAAVRRQSLRLRLASASKVSKAGFPSSGGGDVEVGESAGFNGGGGELRVSESEQDPVVGDEGTESVQLEVLSGDSRGASKGNGKRKSGDLFGAKPVTASDGNDQGNLNLRSGKKVAKRKLNGEISGLVNASYYAGKVEGEGNQADADADADPGVSVLDDLGAAVTESDNKKGKLIVNVAVFDEAGARNDDVSTAGEGGSGSRKRRLTREEKGKGMLIEEDLLAKSDVAVVEVDIPLDVPLPVPIQDNVELHVEVAQAARDDDQRVNNAARPQMERFRNIARRNAARFAHFNAETGEEFNDATAGAVREEDPTPELPREAEDWPGPFSTAMKIIKDRANRSMQRGSSPAQFSKKGQPLWVPKQIHGPQKPKLVPLSLEDLSMEILLNNSYAISSLDSVPDVLRHKLCQKLSDSRRMTGHLFKLLLSGSSTEVRVRDSSWLSEEEFAEHFAGCNTDNLTVLQLDQCGRCMPDYILHTTLARTSNSLPALVSLSLQAACRLSDSGLAAIVSAAPRLKSINLSQCSLLTSAGIDNLANSLGPMLKELYIDDCQGIDVMQCLPGLSKVKCLEVLSVAGVESVCDDFIKEIMITHGQFLKELILTDCRKLTDSSLKAIADNSSGLCALNLVNLSNLTDIGIGYLANGILKFQILKLCRNAFSDEAVAAFIETSGESTEELWLNNINAVGPNTAVSLAKHLRKLVTLDVSWCRNMSDDALGLIVDNCDSLRVLKIFGCTQLTDTFFDGHSNLDLQIIGKKMTPILKHIKVPNPIRGPLRYSSSD